MLWFDNKSVKKDNVVANIQLFLKFTCIFDIFYSNIVKICNFVFDI